VPKNVHVMIVALHLSRPLLKAHDSARDGLTTTLCPIFLILFLPRSGFGVYSMDRHVSIEKYNMLWFKGIAT
jgi:hypothetical protein